VNAYNADMAMDPMSEFAELRQNYEQMLDGELEELDRDKNDLSPTAQGVLLEELKKRGLGAWGKRESEKVERKSVDEAGSDDGDESDEPAPAADAVYDERGQFVDTSGKVFTYKTLLCECNEVEWAYQLNELLRRNGIDSWVSVPGRGRNDPGLPTKVEVGADQLEQAKIVIAQPMPQEIIKMFQEMNEDVQEFEIEHCPACGAEDPTLEGVEPVNQWLCESCGHTWSDEAPAAE
jgi:hypothetical protein